MSPTRYCCDGKCNEHQGRGGCPALDQGLTTDSDPTDVEMRRIWIGLAVTLCVFGAGVLGIWTLVGGWQ